MSTRGDTLSARPHPAPDVGDGSGTTDRATAPLRLWIYGLVLALLAFVQSPGRIVGDTKFDLVVNPGGFMDRALDMWDGSSSFGQIQNQAYGYFFPMGPFFWAGDQLHLDMWVVQRLWWTLLLCLAFFGALTVARTLGLGRPWAQVVAAFAFALSTHVTTVIGPTSIEVWPGALAPWVLWCVIRGTRGGSERRWAAAAGLLMAACGGVNAAAVLGAMPLGVCWLATRRGRRAWVFLGWWVATTLMATLWWLVPLFLLGAYSFPFLDYIENATITTLPTGLSDVLAGTSDWVFFYGGSMFPAGHALATTPYLLLDAMVLVAFGLAGIARRDNPHRGFLLLSVVVGTLLVSFGFTGNGHGWFADTRQAWLDGALAPLRNLHKFDNVLRLPLALGLAHLLGGLKVVGAGSRTVNRVAALVAILALVATASPWWLPPRIAPTGTIETVPNYWRQAADYLDRRNDGTTTLVVPASGFGLYLWGSPRDDVLQPLTSASWATRSVIPFAQPGSVVLLDALTDVIESGRPTNRLARVLADNGIKRVLVRNDLDRVATGAPDPVALHAVLNRSSHIVKDADFGPRLGNAPAYLAPNGVRIARSDGLSGSYAPVEVYRVTLPVAPAQAMPASSVRVTAGGAPGDGLLGGATIPRILGEPGAAAAGAGVELSDALPRREEDFAEVRDVASATMTADQPWRLDRPVHQRLMLPDQERWESTVAWRGVRGVTASSSRAWPDSRPPMRRDAAPGAAVDGSSGTAWQSAAGLGPVGQWWQMDLPRGTDVGRVRIVLPPDSTVTSLELSNGQRRIDVPAPDGGEPLDVSTGFGPSDRLRVTALAAGGAADQRPFALSEVAVDGVHPQRTVVLPRPPEGRRVARVSLTRDVGRPGCLDVRSALVCRDDLPTVGDDGTTLDRTFTLDHAGPFHARIRASWLPGPAVTRELGRQLPFGVATSRPATTNVRGGALALVDGDLRTTWVSAASVEDPAVTVTFPTPRTVGRMRLELSDTAAAVPPTAVTIRAGAEHRAVRLGKDGAARFRPLHGTTFRIRVDSAALGYDNSDGGQARLPTGAGGLALFAGRGGPDLLDTAGAELRGRCGTGPGLTVNGSAVSTRYTASLHQLMRGRGTVLSCRNPLHLVAGVNHVVATANDVLVVDHVQLNRPGSGPVTPPTPVRGSVSTDTRRTLDVPTADGARLLVVSQNYNDGWSAELDGHRLRAQEVDGWRQGWWLPAGSGGTVTMTFGPQSQFVAGLLVGVAGLLLTFVLLLVRARRRDVRAATSARRLPVGVGATAMVLAGGLLAGWAGAGAVLATLAILAVSEQAREQAWLLAGSLALVGGAVAAQHRADAPLGYLAWVQWMLAAALAAAFPVVSRPKGPHRRRRMKGISIT